MNDRPKTMLLSPHEWRTLIQGGLQHIHAAVSAPNPGAASGVTGVPDSTELAWLHGELDRLKMQVSAWGASGQPATPMVREISDEAAEEAIQGLRDRANGAGVTVSEPKKKRGWQKGRKRGPRKAKGTEAVQ